MGNEEIRNAASEDVPVSEPAPEWSGNELDDIPPTRVSYPGRRIIAMSEEEMRKAGLIFAVIMLLFAASGIFLSRFSPARTSFDLANCVHITRNADRLSCYDRAAMSGAAPFKGASPFSTYSRSDLETPG